MRFFVSKSIFIAVTALSVLPASAQRKPWEEYEKKISTSSTIAPLGPELFGESIDLYNGRLSFRHVDVDIPGNSSLPVRASRSYSGEERVYQMMANWTFEVPHLGGTFAADVNGITHPSYNWPGQRCSGSRTPPIVENYFWPVDYWHGISTNIPGGGELLEPAAGAQSPTSGGPYRWVTTGNTWISCLPSIRNGSGEGFLAITPDGTKYWFDWMSMSADEMIERYVPAGPEPDQVAALQLSRNKVLLHATRVEDRFGNWVTYTYTNTATAQPRLEKIESNDGRIINLAYNSSGVIASISSAGRTWLYQYSGGSLVRVELPDASSWSFDLPLIEPSGGPPTEDATCSHPGHIYQTVPPPAAWNFTHPSGAKAQFLLSARLHGRSHVPKNCLSTGDALIGIPESGTYSDFVRMYWVDSVVKKKIYGPGLPEMQWDFRYNNSLSLSDLQPSSPPIAAGPGSWATVPYGGNANPSCLSDGCAAVVTTEVFGPDGRWIRYTHGNSYRYNEHKLLKVERGTGPTSVLETEQMTYELAQAAQAFPALLGTSTQYKGDSFTETFQNPLRSRKVTRDGVVFNLTNNTFDTFARPLNVTKSSSPAP